MQERERERDYQVIMITPQNFARTNYVIKAEERKQRSINKCLTIYGKLKRNQQTDLITKHTVSKEELTEK